MSSIKNFFYLILILPICLQAEETETVSIKMPSVDKLAQTAVDLKKSLDTFTTAMAKSIDQAVQSSHDLLVTWKPSGIGTLALVTGLYSARQLFSEYPKKPVDQRTKSDLIIPAIGFTFSAGTLIYLWSLQNN